MKKIVKYEVAIHYTADELEDIIKKYIKMGWQPYGNLVVIKINDHCTMGCKLYQPMVKYED